MSGAGKIKPARPLYVYFGHHKCASTYLTDVLHQICWDLKFKILTAGSPKSYGHDLAQFVHLHRPEFLICNQAEINQVGQLGRMRAAHVVRDPRDILVSAYYSHLNSHSLEEWPELAAHREKLQELSKEEGLLCEIECRADQFKAMMEWDYSQPNVLEVRFEDLVSNPYQTMLEIFRFLGLLDESDDRYLRALGLFVQRSLRALEGRHRFRLRLPFGPDRIPIERLLRIVWQNDFEKKSGGRRRGEEDQDSHYRRGVPGDWKLHFNEALRAAFKERYNPMLIKLGYESGPDW